VVTRLKEAAARVPTGIGIGVAGLIDASLKRVLASPNCPALNGAQLPSDLMRRTGLPVGMDNDANLAALGEGACGAARGARHFIAVTLGTGIGGAVISDGRLIRGVVGGGELGHIPVSLRGPRCNCGAHGCLESYIGRAGIDRYVGRRAPALVGVGLKEIHRRAGEGDKGAVQVFAYIGRTLGVALAGLVNIFDPEMIVIGGGVAAAADLILPSLQKQLAARVFPAYLDGLKVRPAELGTWAGVVGAWKMMQDRVAVVG